MEKHRDSAEGWDACFDIKRRLPEDSEVSRWKLEKCGHASESTTSANPLDAPPGSTKGLTRMESKE